MSLDVDMREIEAALTEYGALCFLRAGPAKTKPAADKLLALIRAKLGNAAQNAATCAQGGGEVAQNDAEHEAKVEAWEAEATRISIHCGVAMQLVQRMRDDGASLMRARPAAITWPSPTPAVDYAYEKAVAKEKAAGELLRAAKNMAEAVSAVVPDEPLDELSPVFEMETKRHHWERVVDCRDRLEKAIEAFERAGVTP